MSIIEQLIRDKEFGYLQPWFYSNEYALRCELSAEAFVTKKSTNTAREKAIEIFNILFPNGADALFFNYLIFDYSIDNNEKLNDSEIKEISKEAEKDISFLLSYQNKYRNEVITDLKKDEVYGENLIRRNRIICYLDNDDFDYKALIGDLVNVDFGVHHPYETSFVSFENECIFSIYDDRGCDIVFATKEKYKEFFTKLEKYLFSYDLEEMIKRYNS